MQTFRIENFSLAAVSASADRICYMLYPFDGLEYLIENVARAFDVTMVMITGMDWDNDLTPWPAKGEPPGSPDFEGLAPEFFKTLTTRVLSTVESRLGIARNAERTLAGVSLSGLFTLWQWMLSDIFTNIISLSGSFWYEGFADWVTSHKVRAKAGRAYFLLGDREARTSVKAFQPVQTDTVKIVNYLHDNGVSAMFELVPGNHYQHAAQRLTRALTWMFGTASIGPSAE